MNRTVFDRKRKQGSWILSSGRKIHESLFQRTMMGGRPRSLAGRTGGSRFLRDMASHHIGGSPCAVHPRYDLVSDCAQTPNFFKKGQTFLERGRQWPHDSPPEPAPGLVSWSGMFAIPVRSIDYQKLIFLSIEAKLVNGK